MADNDGMDGDDHGGFVFDNERPTNDGVDTAGNGLTTTIVIAAVLIVAVVIVAAVGQSLVMGSMTDPLAGNSGSAGNGTSGSTSLETATGTETTPITNGGEPVPASVTTTTTLGTNASPTSPATTARTTRTPTSVRTTTPARTTTTRTDRGGENGNGSQAKTTPGSRSPMIDRFTITDRSSGGTATFDVAWNVSDPNRDLTEVTVGLVADPGGVARTVEQRRFDAGGARSAGNTTFEVPEGDGMVYELRIEAVDATGNAAFELTREVAEGSQRSRK